MKDKCTILEIGFVKDFKNNSEYSIFNLGKRKYMTGNSKKIKEEWIKFEKKNLMQKQFYFFLLIIN